MHYFTKALVVFWTLHGMAIIIIIINEEEIRVTLSHRDFAGALYII